MGAVDENSAVELKAFNEPFKLDELDFDNLDFKMSTMSEADAKAQTAAYEDITPTSITELSPEQLRLLAERMIRRGDLTTDDLQAVRTEKPKP